MANMLNIEHFVKAITVQYSKDWLFFKFSEHILAMAVWQNVHKPYKISTLWWKQFERICIFFDTILMVFQFNNV